MSFDVNTNIFSTPLFSSREISCIFHYVSYLLLLSYIKGFEDKEPDFENIILLKIYSLVLTTSSAEREKLSINYFNALCKTRAGTPPPDCLLVNSVRRETCWPRPSCLLLFLDISTSSWCYTTQFGNPKPLRFSIMIPNSEKPRHGSPKCPAQGHVGTEWQRRHLQAACCPLSLTLWPGKNSPGAQPDPAWAPAPPKST